MERKSHENFYDKGTYTYYEIANMAKSKTSIDHPSVSFSKRDEEVKIHEINGGRPSKACIVHSDDFSHANRGLSPSPETVKACDDLSPRPSTLNQSTGRQEVFEVPVTNDDHHNLHNNNTHDDATYLIDPIIDQRNATPTLTESIIPYKFLALICVVGIVIASLIVIPVIVISINKDTNNNDVTRCSDDTWSKWSECSTSCGQGFQKRMKECSNGIDNTESRQCANKSCEIGTSDVTRCSDDTWSKWSECSTSCGQGFQIRMKGCSYGINNTESRQCANKSCEIGTSDLPKCLQKKWSSWTRCNTSCGQGVQTRVKRCSYGVNKTESKDCSISSCKEGSCHFDLILDQSTRHALCYLSTDHRVVSNYYSLETPVTPQSVNQLKNFQGVIGKPCIEPGRIVYYEIGYSYTIISNDFIKSQYRVLDFGLTDTVHVDCHHHIGNNDHEWAFSMNKCSYSNKICISALYNGRWSYLSYQLSDIVIGTSQNGTIAIFVNRLKQEISLIDVQQKLLLYKLKSVKTDKDLCPVFGAGYNVRAVKSSITLLDSRLLFQQLDDSLKDSTFQILKGLL